MSIMAVINTLANVFHGGFMVAVLKLPLNARQKDRRNNKCRRFKTAVMKPPVNLVFLVRMFRHFHITVIKYVTRHESTAFSLTTDKVFSGGLNCR